MVLVFFFETAKLNRNYLTFIGKNFKLNLYKLSQFVRIKFFFKFFINLSDPTVPSWLFFNKFNIIFHI